LKANNENQYQLDRRNLAYAERRNLAN